MKNKISFYYNDSEKENWGLALLPQIGLQGSKWNIDYITFMFLFWSLEICLKSSDE